MVMWQNFIVMLVWRNRDRRKELNVQVQESISRLLSNFCVCLTSTTESLSFQRKKSGNQSGTFSRWRLKKNQINYTGQKETDYQTNIFGLKETYMAW